MKCPKCNEGEFEVYQTRISDRYGCLTRKRVCTKCEYSIRTIEINLDTFKKDHDFISDVQMAIAKYNGV